TAAPFLEDVRWVVRRERNRDLRLLQDVRLERDRLDRDVGMSGVVLLRDVVPELQSGALVGVVPPDERHGLLAVIRARSRQRARHEYGHTRNDDPCDCERLPASHEVTSSLHRRTPEVAWCPIAARV